MRKLLLLTFLIAGCGDSLSPTDGIIVSAAAPAVSMKVGQAAQVEIAVQNTSDEARQLGLPACEYVFEILNQAGDVIGPGGRVCSLALWAPTEIAAHSSLSYTDTWDGGGANDQPLPAGSYQLRPRVMVMEGGFVYGQLIPLTIVP